MTTRYAAVEEAVAEKRRKLGNGELWSPASSLIQSTTEEKEDTGRPCTAARNPSSNHVPISCRSSNGSTEELQSTDLEESVKTRTLPRYNWETETSNQTIEFKAGSGLPETITAKPSSTFVNSRRTVPPEKIPPAAEVEEFFASAEKDLHKRFKDKYNYDIENDAPLEGRYEWVSSNNVMKMKNR